MKNYQLKEMCLEITNHCPLDCVHCSTKSQSLYGESSFHLDEIMKIIDEFSELGGKALEISGGEPLSHPNLCQILAYAKRHDLETRLYTSAYLMSKVVWNRIVNTGLDKVIFNLQAHNAEIHDFIAGKKGIFRKVIESVHMLRGKLWLGVHFVPMKLNLNELESTFHLCCNLGIDEFAVLRLVSQGAARKNRSHLELSPFDIYTLLNKLNQFRLQPQRYSHLRIGVPLLRMISVFGDGTNIPDCGAGKTKCLIKAGGEVVPCPALKQESQYVLGNAKKESLSTVWNKKAWKEFRDFDYHQLEPPCLDCCFLPQCQGGCPAQRVLFCKNVSKGPDPYCIMH